MSDHMDAEPTAWRGAVGSSPAIMAASASDRGKNVEKVPVSTIVAVHVRYGFWRDGTHQIGTGGVSQGARFSTDAHQRLNRKEGFSELKDFPRFFHDSCHETQKNTMFHSV